MNINTAHIIFASLGYKSKGFKLLMFWFVLAFLPNITLGQQQVLTIVQKDLDKIILNYNSKQKSPVNSRAEINKVISDLRKTGFLLANLDSFKTDTLTRTDTAWIYHGLRFKNGKVNLIYSSDSTLIQSVTNEFGKGYFSPMAIERKMQKIIKTQENQGFPFARTSLTGVSYNEASLSFDLKIDKNDRIFIDTIKIGGNGKLTTRFLEKYLDIKPGDVYNEARIKAIKRKIADLEYVEETQPTKVYFYNDRAQVYLNLKHVNTNQFDGIIGIFPKPNNEGGVLITGDLSIKLTNTFKRGELIYFNWKSIRPGVQDLIVKFNYPFLLGLPLGFNSDFNLFYRDSIFLEVNSKNAIQYQVSAQNYLRLFLQNRSFSVLNESLRATKDTAGISDIRGNIWGFESKIQRYDNGLFPTEGYSIRFTLGAGTKNSDFVSLNQNIETVPYRQAQIELDLHYFIKESARFNTLFSFQGKWLQSERIFNNELYRIGGFKTLRGFDEESILSNKFGIIAVEQRFLLPNRSFFFAFGNMAAYSNTANPDNLITDTPYGLGAGLSFQTKSGQITLAYALGHQFDNKIEFKAAKIHFGYLYVL